MSSPGSGTCAGARMGIEFCVQCPSWKHREKSVLRMDGIRWMDGWIAGSLSLEGQTRMDEAKPMAILLNGTMESSSSSSTSTVAKCQDEQWPKGSG
jgi:hypothetical protein